MVELARHSNTATPSSSSSQTRTKMSRVTISDFSPVEHLKTVEDRDIYTQLQQISEVATAEFQRTAQNVINLKKQAWADGITDKQHAKALQTKLGPVVLAEEAMEQFIKSKLGIIESPSASQPDLPLTHTPEEGPQVSQTEPPHTTSNRSNQTSSPTRKNKSQLLHKLWSKVWCF